MFFFSFEGRKLNSLDNHKINFPSECLCAYIPVRRSLGSINQFISQTFSSDKKIYCLVHTAKWRDINSLPPNHTCCANSSRIFSWTTMLTHKQIPKIDQIKLVL